METISTYDEKSPDRLVTLPNNSGFFVASDPFDYTMTSSYGLIIRGNWFVAEDIQALDNLSDEMGITHEAAEGEVVENSNDE